MTDRLTGKRVLVTGAARGMGRSHAVRLAQEGADVILVDICEDHPAIEYALATEENLAETVRLVEKTGQRAVSRIADVRDLAALTEAVDSAVAELGGLDAAVANAGVLTVGTWDTTTPEHWDVVLDVNLKGVWNTCRVAIPHLIEHGGSLINVSSAAGLKGSPLTLPYTAAKHGVIGLSKALANELAESYIRVNTVIPTSVATGMTPMSLLTLLTDVRPDLAPLFQNAIPVIVVEDFDVSNAVVFLASDESRFVTGTELKVDAGMTTR